MSIPPFFVFKNRASIAKGQGVTPKQAKEKAVQEKIDQRGMRGMSPEEDYDEQGIF